MPVLPIAETGCLSCADSMKVAAAMSFPDDGESRIALLARFHERVAGETEAALGSGSYAGDSSVAAALMLARWLQPFGGFLALSRSPCFEEALDRFYAQSWRGCIAGDILSCMLKMKADSVPSSVNKAIWIVHDYLQEATTAGGENLGCSHRYIRECWSKFKSVSHLWAAFRISFFSDGIDFKSLPPVDPDELEIFLGIAEWVAEAGLAHQSHGGRMPLQGVDLWRTPKHLKLKDVALTPPPLEDWAREVLSRYKAPNHTI